MSVTLLRIHGLAGVLLLVFGCGGGGPAAFPDEDRLVESLMEEYVSERFRFYPVERTLAGLPGGDAELGSFSRTDIAGRIGWLYDFHNKLMGVRLQALSQPAYLDTLWLTSLVKAERFDLEDRRLWSGSAAFYGDSIRSGLVALLLAPDLESRSDALRGRLEAVPLLLQQARENLAETDEASRSEARDALVLLRDLLSEMPVFLEERLPAYRVAELTERSRLANRELQQLLSGSPSASATGGAPSMAPLGESGLSRFLLYREMVDWPPDRILREAEESLGVLAAEITELALDEFPDQGVAKLLSAEQPSSSPEASLTDYEEKVRRFLGESAGGEGEALPVRALPRYFLAPRLVTLWRPAALSPPKEAALLVSVDATELGERELELLALGEVAGRYQEFQRQARSASLLRRVFRARTTAEGFIAWILPRLLARGYGGEDPDLRLRYLSRTLVETLRLSLSVRVHAFGMSLPDAERELRDRGFLSRERAAVEARRLAVDPGAGSAALGRLLLEDLVRDYRDKRPLASPAEVETALLSEGLLPLRLIRFRLLGIEPD